ncbi:hypothetical protein CMZ84_04370 [Lysobacteraceae bacterium NML93-0399]|nr:hypothetical protein CMZ84_04370 [Xanthomonadaceae bacterium NML93-0399]
MDQYVNVVLGTLLVGYISFWISRWRVYEDRLAWVSLAVMPIGAAGFGYGWGGGSSVITILLGLLLGLPALLVLGVNLEALFSLMGRADDQRE